jgi:hypothetical protein
MHAIARPVCGLTRTTREHSDVFSAGGANETFDRVMNWLVGLLFVAATTSVVALETYASR